MKKSLMSTVVVVLILSFMMNSVVFAVEKKSASHDMVDFVNDALPFILEQNKGLLSMESLLNSNSVEIGNEIPLYYVKGVLLEKAEYKLYPVFFNGSIISVVREYVNEDGESVFSCIVDASYLDALTGNGEFALVYGDEGLYSLDCEGHFSLIKSMKLQGIADSIEQIVIDDSINYNSIRPVEQISVNAYKTSYGTQSTDYNLINIRNVSNASTTCCPGGICWAACLASIANYYVGTNYTALSFHNSVDCNLYKQAYHEYEIIFLNNVGVLTSRSYYTDNLTYNTLKGYIDSNEVALLDLQSYSSGVAHNVVASGYYWSGSGAKKFYYMDPNVGTVLNDFPSSGTVYIVASGIAYGVHCYILCY